jgi:MFS family permease
MRRLLVLVGTLVAVETMLFAALTPLLPHFAEEFGFSKSRVGVLVAAYAAGALVGGLPGGMMAARIGGRRAVLVGLTLMGIASLGFAFAGSFATLFVARFIQGCAGGCLWAGAFAWLLAVAPRERRGELLGTAMGAAVFGALLGPVLGAAAAIAGRGPVFAGLAGVAVVLGGWAMRLEETGSPERPTLGALLGALRNPRFVGGLSLMALPSLLFGVLAVLAPLHLSAAGWGAAAIGAVWLVGAGLETVQAPLIGRLSDRRGRLFPVRFALVAGAAVSAMLAIGFRPLLYAPLIVFASLAYGVLFTPGFALIADGADEVGLAQGMAFGVMNAAWALGAMIGPAAGGAIANATGDWIPFVLAAALCVATLVAVRRRSEDERAAVLVDRLARDAAGVRTE